MCTMALQKAAYRIGTGTRVLKLKKRGSMTIEAALAIPTFILFTMTFVMLFNILLIHKAMQEALTDTALTYSTHSYLGYKSGLLSAEGEIASEIDAKAGPFKTVVASFSEFYSVMSEGSDAINDQDFSTLMESLEGGDLTSLYDTEDPQAFGVGLAYTVSQFVYEEGKAGLIGPLTNVMIRKYFESHHGWSVAWIDQIWLSGELDYSDSRYYGVSPEIKLTVHYTVQPFFLDGILPDFRLSNSVTVRCWGPGDAGGSMKKETVSGWITPSGFKQSGVFHTMKCMSLNNNDIGKNVAIPVERYGDEKNGFIYSSVYYKGRMYTHCKNCENGGILRRESYREERVHAAHTDAR